MIERAGRRGLIVSRGWVQAAGLVTAFGFTELGWLAIRAHTDAPPVPLQVVDPAGNVVFTGADVMQGQAIFLRNGLMEYDSIFGHGAYLGPEQVGQGRHPVVRPRRAKGPAGRTQALQQRRVPRLVRPSRWMG